MKCAAKAFVGTALAVAAISSHALTAVDDRTTTAPNAPVEIEPLGNDGLTTNSSGILRVTQPLHGRVVIHSAATKHAELTPLFQFAARQLSNSVTQVQFTNRYPWYLTNGVWRDSLVNDDDWISGFFPGSLWMIYEYTGDTNYSNWAKAWMPAITAEQFSTNTDDVGFMFNTSYGNGYRLTGDPQYKSVLLQAAQSLSNRFNTIVGCLADDQTLTPPPFEVIMDTMMNSELLYVAQDLGGDINLVNIALSHAGRTVTNHIRADGSTFHRVMYNATDSSVMFRDNRAITNAADTWARGHAWATYSFPMFYRRTGQTRFLDAAKEVADFYIANVPSDYVPYWYYAANGNNPTLRDSSAASITLAGLLDLSQNVTNATDAGKYWAAAHNIFTSLSSTNYLAVNTTNALLLHGNPVDANVDTSLIYGDYYFIESLKRFNDIFSQTTLTYIPKTNFTGTDMFKYQICDSSGAVSDATVTVQVGLKVTVSLSSEALPLISFLSTTSKTYFIEYANELPLNVWGSLATNIAGTGSMISITDPEPSTGRFYRAGEQ